MESDANILIIMFSAVGLIPFFILSLILEPSPFC